MALTLALQQHDSGVWRTYVFLHVRLHNRTVSFDWLVMRSPTYNGLQGELIGFLANLFKRNLIIYVRSQNQSSLASLP